MSILQKRKNSARGSEISLKTNQFFNDGNANGYVSKEEFLYHIDGLPAREAQELEQFFSHLQAGTRLDTLPVPRKDRANNDYIWCNFQMPKGTRGIKVLLFGNILEFIKAYQEGAFSTPFSLVDLYEEADKASVGA